VRGEAWTAALVPMGVLAAFALVVGGLAARLFRWETV
jgi:ABC-2 type transport system permease protein